MVLITPTILDHSAYKISQRLEKRIGFDSENDLLLYQITSKSLQGSYDSRISIKVETQKFISVDQNGKNVNYKINCSPYLRIELSLHKFFLGHNCYGGSDDLIYQVSGLYNWLNEYFDTVLPDYNNWIVQRLDYARVYKLPDIDNFYRGFQTAYYPRREVIKFSEHSLYFPGSYTTLKLYNKEKEYYKHDRKRLRKVFSIDKLKELEHNIEGILRIELEFRSKKLKHIYEKRPKVSELNIEDIKQQFEIELQRIFKIKGDNMMTYNTNTSVREQIYNNYKTSLANTLYGVWCQLSINGYDYVRQNTPDSTFYRYINQLKEIGIVWNNTDLHIQDTTDYVFNPLNTEFEIKEDLIAA